MKLNKSLYYSSSFLFIGFAVAYIILALGAYLKIESHPFANAILLVGLILQIQIIRMIIAKSAHRSKHHIKD